MVLMLMDFYTGFQGYGVSDINCFTYHRRCPIRYRLKPPTRVGHQHIHPRPERYSDDELVQAREVCAFSDSELLDRWNEIPSYMGSIFEAASSNRRDYEVPYFPGREKTRQKLHANARSESLPPSCWGPNHRLWTKLPPWHERYRDSFPNFQDFDQETHDYSAKDDDHDSYLGYGSADYASLSGKKCRRRPTLDSYRDFHSLYGTSTVFEDSNTDDNDSSVRGSEDRDNLPQSLQISASEESFLYTLEGFRPLFSHSVDVLVEDTTPVVDNAIFTGQQPIPWATRFEAHGEYQDRCLGGHVSPPRSGLRCQTIADSDEELAFSTPDPEAATFFDQDAGARTNKETMESDTEHYITSPSLPARNQTTYSSHFNAVFPQYSNYVSSSAQSPRNNQRYGHRLRPTSRLQWRRRRTSDLRKDFLNQAAINRERCELEQDRIQLLQVREELEQDHEKIERERQKLYYGYAQCRALASRLRDRQEELRLAKDDLENAWNVFHHNEAQRYQKNPFRAQDRRYYDPFPYTGYAASGTYSTCGTFDDPLVGNFGDWDRSSRAHTYPLDAIAAAKALESYISAWRATPIPPPVIWPTSSLTSAPLLILPPPGVQYPTTWLRDPDSKRHEITKYNTITFFASAFTMDVPIIWPQDKEEEYEFKIPALERVEAGVLEKVKELVGDEVKRWHQDKSDLWGLSEVERELAFAVFEGIAELRKAVRRELRRRGMGAGRW